MPHKLTHCQPGPLPADLRRCSLRLCCVHAHGNHFSHFRENLPLEEGLARRNARIDFDAFALDRQRRDAVTAAARKADRNKARPKKSPAASAPARSSWRSWRR